MRSAMFSLKPVEPALGVHALGRHRSSITRRIDLGDNFIRDCGDGSALLPAGSDGSGVTVLVGGVAVVGGGKVTGAPAGRVSRSIGSASGMQSG